MVRKLWLVVAAIVAGLVSATLPGLAAERPSILLILLDDMGYGDPGSFNPESRIPTPALDRLAAEGMRFLDAHAPGSVCVPSRYGLMTGFYPFRMPRRRGPLLDEDQRTLPEVLRDQGYATACIGKWHLGFENEKDPSKGPLVGGPVDHGFDYYFGIPASLDIPPYYFIRNRNCVQPPTGWIEANNTPGWTPIQGAFWRAGPIAPGFRHAEVLDRLVEEAISQLGRLAATGQPFFLYVALTAPHTPWLPPDDFRGVSRAGLYGDFVAYTDAQVGRILVALKRLGMDRNTLVIVTSDNGPVWYPQDVERFGHRSAGIYRGMKGDLWEGGHRVPLVVRWPGRVPRNTKSSYPISFVDILPTFADLLGVSGVVSGIDGQSFAAELFAPGTMDPTQRVLVMQGSSRRLAIRKGYWKFIPFEGSGGFSRPSVVSTDRGQLYDLRSDPAEQRNLWNERAEKVSELRGLLDALERS